jgi:hypothetical protein
VPIIEKLCDQLRALRRENPESFFNKAEHALYARLEAALENYYRSKVQEKDAHSAQ